MGTALIASFQLARLQLGTNPLVLPVLLSGTALGLPPPPSLEPHPRPIMISDRTTLSEFPKSPRLESRDSGSQARARKRDLDPGRKPEPCPEAQQHTDKARITWEPGGGLGPGSVLDSRLAGGGSRTGMCKPEK